jgi:predicted GTPase
MVKRSLILTFWLEILAVLLTALPLFSLLGLGALWLLENRQSWHWLLALFAASGVGVLTLRQALASKAASRPAPKINSSYSPAEAAAWKQVQLMADGFDVRSIGSPDAVAALVEAVFREVSATLYPDTTDAHYNFTAPEALRALSQKSAELAEFISSTVPGAHEVSVRHLMWMHRHRHLASGALKVYKAYKAGKSIYNMANPVDGLVRSGISEIANRALDFAQISVTRTVSTTIVCEIGAAAIELYGGRFQTRGREPVDARQPLAKPPVVRILLLGQANAGKSSLLNALARISLAPVQATPTPTGSTEFRIAADVTAAGEIILVDHPGILSLDNQKTLLNAALNADCILWVSAATAPGRTCERETRRAVRRALDQRPNQHPPAEILVMSKVDQLKPPREWTPPYDIATPQGIKAANIRAARDAVAQALDFSPNDAVPVAVVNGEAFNVDGLWQKIGEKLPQAEHAVLHKMLDKTVWTRVSEFKGQMIGAGGFLLKTTAVSAVEERGAPLGAL